MEVGVKQIPLFERALEQTCIQELSDSYGDNAFYMKRDDTVPFSFGGNKARKAAEFYREIKDTDTDVVMTYGSNSSNHCRIIADMAASMGLECHIISPEENMTTVNNTRLVRQFGAVIETCPVSCVAGTIERRKEAYRRAGRHPYFIEGGGHGNPGVEAYVKAYREIEAYEREHHRRFDYIFHASGTGATQDWCADSCCPETGSGRSSASVSHGRDSGAEALSETVSAAIWAGGLWSCTGKSS